MWDSGYCRQDIYDEMDELDCSGLVAMFGLVISSLMKTPTKTPGDLVQKVRGTSPRRHRVHARRPWSLLQKPNLVKSSVVWQSMTTTRGVDG